MIIFLNNQFSTACKYFYQQFCLRRWLHLPNTSSHFAFFSSNDSIFYCNYITFVFKKWNKFSFPTQILLNFFNMFIGYPQPRGYCSYLIAFIEYSWSEQTFALLHFLSFVSSEESTPIFLTSKSFSTSVYIYIYNSPSHQIVYPATL